MSSTQPLPGARRDWQSVADELKRDGAGHTPALLKALSRFEAQLGSNWPGWTSFRPLAAHFTLTFGNRPPEGVRIHGLLEEIGNEDACADIVRRLGASRWRDYQGALTEVEVIAALQRGGNLTERIRQAPGKARTADVRVKLGEQWADIECTALMDSEPMEMAHAVFSRLFSCLQCAPKLACGVRVRFANGLRACDAFRRLAELERAALAVGVGRAPIHISELASVEPIQERDAPGAVELHGGLGIGNADGPFTQLSRAVRHKLRRGQLAKGLPGILVVRTDAISFYGRGRLPLWLNAVAERVDDCLAQTKSEISAVLVYERWRGAQEPPLRLAGPRYTATVASGADGWSTFTLLVHNVRARYPLAAQEADRLVDPAMTW